MREPFMDDGSNPRSTDGAEREPAAATEVQAPEGFAAHIDAFTERVVSLAETVPLATVVIDRTSGVLAEQCNKFLGEHGEAVQDGFFLPADKVNAYSRLDKRFARIRIAHRILSRSFVVALLSEFDAFVSGLLRLYYKAQPDALKESDRSLTLSELLEFGSIDSARDYIIEKEIETVLRKSPAEQFDALEKRLGIPLRKGLTVWPAFIELNERRNLFVHNDGVVTRHYLETCKKAGCDVGAVSRGVTLPISDSYFRKAHEIIFELGVKLGHVMWRKTTPSEREDADKHLAGHMMFNLVAAGRHRLAIVLGDFAAETLKQHFTSDMSRRILVVNRSQAHKWSGNNDKAMEILGGEDWSASSAEFRLAVAALRDDFAMAVKVMRTITPGEPPDKEGYRDWPVFRELRKSPEFQRAFEDIFKEPLNVVAAPPTTRQKQSEAPEDPASPPENSGETLH
jgi:hypothetical protein